MLILHMAAALFAGTVAAVAGLASGHSLGMVVLLYVAGSNLGLLASVAAVLVPGRRPRDVLGALHD